MISELIQMRINIS